MCCIGKRKPFLAWTLVSAVVIFDKICMCSKQSDHFMTPFMNSYLFKHFNLRTVPLSGSSAFSNKYKWYKVFFFSVTQTSWCILDDTGSLYHDIVIVGNVSWALCHEYLLTFKPREFGHFIHYSTQYSSWEVIWKAALGRNNRSCPLLIP